MAVRTQQRQVFLRTISPVAINMVNVERHATRCLISLTPTAATTLFTILLDQITANMIRDTIWLLQPRFSSRLPSLDVTMIVVQAATAIATEFAIGLRQLFFTSQTLQASFQSHRVLASKSLSYCTGTDSNRRTRERSDLQSDAFNHSATRANCQVAAGIARLRCALNITISLSRRTDSNR